MEAPKQAKNKNTQAFALQQAIDSHSEINKKKETSKK